MPRDLSNDKQFQGIMSASGPTSDWKPRHRRRGLGLLFWIPVILIVGGVVVFGFIRP